MSGREYGGGRPTQGPSNLPPLPTGLLNDPRTNLRGFTFNPRGDAPPPPGPYGDPHFPWCYPRTLPRGNVVGNPQEIPYRSPLAGLPFQQHYTPHSPLHPLPNFISVPHTPTGMIVSPVGPPGTFFHPPVHQTPPIKFSPQGPKILLPSDPTDVFLSEWLGVVTASYKDRQREGQEDRPMKIPEARGLLSHALDLLSSLRVCQAQLTAMRERGERSGEEWTAIMMQVEKWQKELVDIRDLIDRGDNVQRLGRKLAGIKKKRVRVKEGVRRRRREKELERERSEKKAEQWMQERKKEKLKEETERSVQSDAGDLLGEVKRKLSDMHYYLKLVNTLKELRECRREAHRKTGDPLVKEDEYFASETSCLCEGLSERVSLYEEEEHALRVMVREEVEERMLAESSATGTQGAVTESVTEEGEVEETVEGAVNPYLDYYLMAENSVEALVNVRRSWDVYLSVEGSPVPSQLPHLSSPSSSLWKEYFTTHL